MSNGAGIAAEEASGSGGKETDTPGEAALLVSEFPPPPYYYRRAASLTPPELPIDALERASHRAAAAAAKAQAESERLRLQQDESDKTDAILGGVTAQDEDDGEVVAVFGEIVEDPLLVHVEDICEDPTKIRDQVKRLNREVVIGFVKLVQALVHQPLENKTCRDELSHNVFLMLQECNKFREHQAREILIEMLEKQLEQRRKILAELQNEITRADELLNLTIDA